jgi:tricorn protease
VYFVTLDKDAENPIYPKNNEVDLSKPVVEDSKTKEKANAKKEPVVVVPMVVSPENMNSRILSLPVSVAHYYNITTFEDKVYYMKHDNDIPKTSLCMYDFKQRKETEIMQCSNYAITANNKKMIVSEKQKYYVIDLPSSETKLDKHVSLENMKVWADLKAEWQQIYYESWRQMRDFFYVENMQGVNWLAMKHKYEVLLPYVNHRHDLNYIIGELIGELNVGHAYVRGGDIKQPERIDMGLLGATFSKDKSGYFKIEKVLDGANWSPSLRSPFTEQNVKVTEGNYILEIDGVDVKDYGSLFELLKGKADKQVEITVNTKPNKKDSRKVIVVPIKDESNLYYYNWVQNNIRKVNEATNGQVGYLHIPDMGVDGLNEFVKHFYPQIHKKALIIDDRGNGGGNVSPMIIERLQRQVQRANMARNVKIPTQTPRQMMHGPIVVLINQYSASDGDLFPYGVKHYGIGKVIGVRSWGGVVGIRGTLPFIDGAEFNRPEFASYDHKTGEWIIEGWGVEPDIEIDNDPYQEYMGVDTQLDKAIEVIKEEMKNFKPIHPIPEGPDKSK